MPTVTFDKTSNVTGRIRVQLPKDELSKKLNAELKKESKNVNMKGFRKGKTPVSALRKLMGNQVLGPLLDREIQQALFGYIDENKLKVIFSPIPVEEESSRVQVTATNLADLDLVYDLALEPEFDLKMPDEAITLYTFDANDTFLDEQVENLLKQRGENKELGEDATIEENDLVKVALREVDGGEDSIESTDVSLYIDSLSDEMKEELIGKSIGYETTVSDISKVEKNSTEAYARKYLLNLDDPAEGDEPISLEGKSFTLTVTGISRIEPAELDEELYTQFDPSGGVTDEESLRAKIAEDNAAGFNEQGIGMANFEIQRALVEQNDFELPLDLMKQINEESGQRQFDLFERGVRWMLIRNKFAAEKNIELQYEDIRAEALQSLMRMLGGQRPDFLTDEFVDNYVQNMLKDEKQREELANNALEKKIMTAIREEVTFNEQALDAEAFNETIKEFNEKNTPVEEE